MKKKTLEALKSATGYEDYAYVMQDTGNYYLGAKYTYADIMEQELVPFKFKAITEHYLMKDTELSTSVESHLYYMTKEQFSYQTLFQLKAKVKMLILTPKKKMFSKKTEMVYKEQIIALDDFVDINLAQKKAKGVVVMELVLPKLSLMSFSV